MAEFRVCQTSIWPGQLGSALLAFLQAPATSTLRCLTAFATGSGREVAIGRKTARLRRNGTPAFATRVGGQSTILREAPLFVGYVGATFSGDLALLVDIHAGKAATCGALMMLGLWNLRKS
jgi:hypothetical protein